MVTFYCFLAFSFFFVSVSFSSLFNVSNFHLMPQKCNGCHSPAGTQSRQRHIWCLHPSPLSRMPQAADPWIPPSGLDSQGSGSVCFPAPLPNTPYTPILACYWELRVAQWLAGISGDSLPLFFCFSVFCPDPVLNSDLQFILLLNNSIFVTCKMDVIRIFVSYH